MHISGDLLIDLTGEQIKGILTKCTNSKPLHIIKGVDKKYAKIMKSQCWTDILTINKALIHFRTEWIATKFHHVYREQNKVICPRLGDVDVNLSLRNNQPADYVNFKEKNTHFEIWI